MSSWAWGERLYDREQGDLDAVLAHPGFLPAVRRFVAGDLERYHALDVVSRWMVSDMGRASMSGAVYVLEALGRLTVGAFLKSPPVSRGEVSRGRARLYLHRAVANGLLVSDMEDGRLRATTALRTGERFRAVMNDALRGPLEAVCWLDPGLEHARSVIEEPDMLRRIAAVTARRVAERFDLFPLDRPARLFQGRDGGARMLAHLIGQQAPCGERLLATCMFSRSGLSRASLCSRAHVNKLLKDGEDQGLLLVEEDQLSVAETLSNDLERYFAAVFVVAHEALRHALTQEAVVSHRALPRAATA